jgi:glycogen debranching enzyme
VLTWAALAPLALPDLPETIGRRLVEEHLLDPGEFLTPVAPPSVAASEPSYVPGGGRGPVRRYWRGPTWVNSAWLVWLGLRRLGYEEAAQRLAAGLIGAVEREGLREYYDPRDGAGLGARDFAWSALIAELADPDPAAARSHL